MKYANNSIPHNKNFNNKDHVNFLKMILKAKMNSKIFLKARRFKKKISRQIQIINKACIN